MAYLTGKTLHGNCTGVRLQDGILHCRPDPDESYLREHTENTWLLFYARVVGEPGEKVSVCLEWPHYDPAKNCSNDEWAHMVAHFGTLAPGLIYSSPDERSWSRVAQTRREGDAIFFSVTLTGTTCFLSVGLPYTFAMAEALCETLSASPWIRRELLGPEAHGLFLPLYTCTNPAVPVSEKRSVWYQAAQHPPETAGSVLADELLRYLVSDEAAPLRDRYIFHILPVFSVWNWLENRPKHFSGLNPNRDWENRQLAEVRAVTEYMERAEAAGERFALEFDVHTGISLDCSPDRSVSAVSIATNAPEEVQRRQRRLIELLCAECNFFPPDPSWPDKAVLTQAEGYFLHRFGQGHTIELCRFNYYDKASGRPAFPSQAAYRQLAPDFLRALDRFLVEK